MKKCFAMATIQTRAIISGSRWILAEFAVAMFAAACTVGQAQGDETCLTYVASHSITDIRPYDTEHDRIDDQQLSCQLLTTASLMQEGMARIAAAIMSDDIDALAAMSLPLLFIDKNNAKKEIRTIEEFRDLYGKVFDTQTKNRIASAQLTDLAIARNQGASLDNGWVWYVVADIGGLPRLTTINHSVHAHDQ